MYLCLKSGDIVWTKINFRKQYSKQECARCTHMLTGGEVCFKRSFKAYNYDRTVGFITEIVCQKCQQRCGFHIKADKTKPAKKRK